MVKRQALVWAVFEVVRAVFAAVVFLTWVGPWACAAQERLRVAVFDAELRRSGPGLLLRDIQKGEAQVEAVVQVIAAARPDVLALLSFDWDYDGVALAALVARLEAEGRARAMLEPAVLGTP